MPFASFFFILFYFFKRFLYAALCMLFIIIVIFQQLRAKHFTMTAAGPAPYFNRVRTDETRLILTHRVKRREMRKVNTVGRECFFQRRNIAQKICAYHFFVFNRTWWNRCCAIRRILFFIVGLYEPKNVRFHSLCQITGRRAAASCITIICALSSNKPIFKDSPWIITNKYSATMCGLIKVGGKIQINRVFLQANCWSLDLY